MVHRPARPLVVVDATKEFKKRYKSKSPQQQASVDAAILQVEQDANHPSLNLEPVVGRQGLWSVRGSLDVRLTFEFVGDEQIIFRVNCTHDQVYRRRR